jgi:4-hydroxy-3-polyprenylbenzoate decarboxylase
MSQEETTHLIVGMTGASGVIYGIRLLEVLKEMPEVKTHLVITAAARLIIPGETDYLVQQVEELADKVHDNHDVGAAVASGSFVTTGMVIVPCSVKTLSAVANCYAADLITRAADVTLKEGHPLVLVFRETPLHLGHIDIMRKAAETGAAIFPPVPTFYGRPKSLDDIINGTVGRVLLRLGIENELFVRWQGLGQA